LFLIFQFLYNISISNLSSFSLSISFTESYHYLRQGGYVLTLSVCLLATLLKKLLTDFDKNFQDSSAMIQGTID